MDVLVCCLSASSRDGRANLVCPPSPPVGRAAPSLLTQPRRGWPCSVWCTLREVDSRRRPVGARAARVVSPRRSGLSVRSPPAVRRLLHNLRSCDPGRRGEVRPSEDGGRSAISPPPKATPSYARRSAPRVETDRRGCMSGSDASQPASQRRLTTSLPPLPHQMKPINSRVTCAAGPCRCTPRPVTPIVIRELPVYVCVPVRGYY